MIVICGEALVDLTPTVCDGAEAYVPHPGGSPFNVAVGVARLGVPAAFLGRLSQDFFGRLLRERLLAEGVHPTYLSEGPERTALAFVHVTAHEEPEYSFYVESTADRMLRIKDLPTEFPPEVNSIHFGSFSLVLEPGASTLEALMQREHGRRVISLDPNVRPSLILDPENFRERLHRWIGLSDVVKVSRADLSWLYPGEPVSSVARRWLSLGPSLLVVTMGPDGCLGMTAAESVRLPGRQVEIVDTVGAGDSFMSALLARLHAGMRVTPGLIEELSGAQLRDILDNAVRASALTCTRAGAEPPSRAELEGSPGNVRGRGVSTTTG
ncbi:carbohydrate kinase [Streptomyces sp. NPDC005202]|uniref:carbohydrate kinase family protein n=1 Tax=Streptomyces sp. NPDC005202 TaxID=3157021 RepID=UPI00339FF449